MRIFTPEAIHNKRVLVRLDLDVPISQTWEIEDATRLDAAIPTLQLLIANAQQIIICGHRGRPNGAPDPSLSVKPLIPYLEEQLGESIAFAETWPETPALPDGRIIMLENLRFFPGEEQRDHGFIQQLAKTADVFINEAFGVAHRDQSSTVGVVKALPSYAGLHFAKEVVELSTILHNPIPPFIVVLGGAKLETKLPVIHHLGDTAHAVLVGGLLAQEIHETHQVVEPNVVVADLAESGKDIDSASADRFVSIITKAQMVVWNGPLGKVEEPEFMAGTRKVAEAIIASEAYSVVGGGDTLAALHKLELLDRFDFVSVGGGAMLEFLAGQPLPAVMALE